MAARTRPTCSRPTATFASATPGPTTPLLIALHPHTETTPTPARVPRPAPPAITRTFPVVAPNPARAAGTFPPSAADAAALRYTYGAFSTSPTSFAAADALHRAAVPLHRAAVPATCAGCTCPCAPAPMAWTLCVPVPPLPHATLRAVEYMLAYGTADAGGAATVQTDVLLTTRALRAGVAVPGGDDALDAVYWAEDSAGGGTAGAPRMVRHEAALRLSATLGVASGDADGEWTHYVENTHMAPDVRVGTGAELFLVFHVCEYPTVQMLRSLEVRVSATWQRQEVEAEARAEEERKAKREKAEQARESAEKKAREDEERKERVEAKVAREEERAARKEERQERAAAQKAREEARQKAEAEVIYEDAVGEVASAPMQAKINETLEKKGMERCPEGYTWRKMSWGYLCNGGSHKITHEQLGKK